MRAVKDGSRGGGVGDMDTSSLCGDGGAALRLGREVLEPGMAAFTPGSQAT